MAVESQHKTKVKCDGVLFTQVSQLYDVVQKWDAMSTSIPQVVQRLVAVKELHEQGDTHEGKPVYIVPNVFCVLTLNLEAMWERNSLSHHFTP